jgi:hypothetical protein
VGALIAAFGSFDVDLRSPGAENETCSRRMRRDSEGGAGQCLTIGAVTDVDFVGVDVRLKADLSAVTLAFDFHGGILT